jgi:L-threonylcarbamoyladenylate synthase
MKADTAGIAEAAHVLAKGGLAAFPTETVYGLGADATNVAAVVRLYNAKGRPSFNPLIAHVEDISAAKRAGHFNALALVLAAKFWPGPLTLVVPATNLVCDLARAGLDTVALRVPAHPVAQRLLSTFGKPIAAPSANVSGHVSPTAADHVIADLNGKIDFVLDGGPTPLGLESTIIDCTSDMPSILRSGGTPREKIEQALNREVPNAIHVRADVPSAPGQFASHYATHTKLRLNATEVLRGEALLSFGNAKLSGEECAALALNLSPTGDMAEAAANLFAYLRELDAAKASSIAVAPIPMKGLGEAINDRLARAAAPR